jgi:hypothetical protein
VQPGAMWGVNDVSQWLEAIDLKEYVGNFKKNKVCLPDQAWVVWQVTRVLGRDAGEPGLDLAKPSEEKEKGNVER